MSILNLKSKVECILEVFPETRNCDKKLAVKVWEQYYPQFIRTGANGQKGIWLEDIIKLPSQDGIKRIRAILQNDENKYLPTTQKVARNRGISEEKWLNFVRNNSEHKRL